jgi:NAD+ synthase (glutamine-hydrolysing)
VPALAPGRREFARRPWRTRTRLVFFNLYRQGLIRAAVCVPRGPRRGPGLPTPPRPSSWRTRRHAAGAALALFPELGLTAYSNDDLFHQQALLDAASGLGEVVDASRGCAR